MEKCVKSAFAEARQEGVLAERYAVLSVARVFRGVMTGTGLVEDVCAQTYAQALEHLGALVFFGYPRGYALGFENDFAEIPVVILIGNLRRADFYVFITRCANLYDVIGFCKLGYGYLTCVGVVRFTALNFVIACADDGG